MYIYTMEINEIQKKERKNVRINLSIKKSESLWLKEKTISPQRLFDMALKELMEKTKKQ